MAKWSIPMFLEIVKYNYYSFWSEWWYIMLLVVFLYKIVLMFIELLLRSSCRF